jgi:hypothetical protein
VLAVEEAWQEQTPSQRSSRFASTDLTVGSNVVARAPGGSIRTSSLAPSRSELLIERMNAF